VKKNAPPWSPLPLIRVLVLNAVPLYGVFAAGWSWGTILALYWCESFLGGLLILLRMVIHRGLTRKRGYWRGQLGLTVSTDDSEPRVFKSFVAEFATTTLAFGAAHLIFLALLLAFAGRDPGAAIQRQPLERGLAVIALLLLGGFVVDLQGIGQRPFAWIRALAHGAMGRTVVLQATVIAGVFAVMFFKIAHAPFWLFAVYKFLFEIGGVIPALRWPPEEPVPEKDARKLQRQAEADERVRS
jgi:hypothetical protein